MTTIISQIGDHLEYFILLLLRVSGLLMASPIFGRKNIPNTAKIGLCLVLTYVVFSANPGAEFTTNDNLAQYALLCIKELLFGVVLGYVTTMFFALVQTAGYVIDMQMGFGMVNVFDVQSNISVPLTGNFFFIMLLIAFFTVDGHLRLIYILMSTVTSVPIGQVTLNPQIGLVALEVFALSFVLAINVAMPMIVSGLFGEVFMGFIVRTTPQMNVFVVGIPLKIAMGFLVLLIMIPVYVSFTNVIFDNMFTMIDTMFKGLAGAA